MKNTGCFCNFCQICDFLELHLRLLSLWLIILLKKKVVLICDFSIDFCYQVFKTLQIKFFLWLLSILLQFATVFLRQTFASKSFAMLNLFSCYIFYFVDTFLQAVSFKPFFAKIATTSCKNAETLPRKNDFSCFKSLLVTGLWDITLTSLLPHFQSCCSKFWVRSCIASNFDKGWRGITSTRSWTGYLCQNTVQCLKYFCNWL